MPKATYMYWQKRFDRENPDKELEERILEIRKSHKDYGYIKYYNEQRIKEKLGWMSPVQYRLSLLAA